MITQQLPEKVPELIFFPFTAVLRVRLRIMSLIMGAVAFGFAIFLKESAIYILGAFFLFCDAPMEVIFFLVRKRRFKAYHNGEVCDGTVVKKKAFLMGPQFAVVIRYSVEGKVFNSSRHIPYGEWLRIKLGDSFQIRMEREQPNNWVFCCSEKDSERSVLLQCSRPTK
jgi:hypothetical protein